MSASPLIVGAAQRAQLRTLRERAAERPVDMRGLAERLTSPDVKRAHMDQMNDQTVDLPTAFMVTFSIEIGHPSGTARHMSMSSVKRGRAPTPEAVWMVAEQLGFVGGLEACTIWLEDLQRGPTKQDRAKAVNVVQLLTAATVVERLQ
jgi:hypothetical protein